MILTIVELIQIIMCLEDWMFIPSYMIKILKNGLIKPMEVMVPDVSLTTVSLGHFIPQMNIKFADTKTGHRKIVILSVIIGHDK